MAFARWDRRFFQTTRGRVVALLRGRRHTVEELAGELALTDNAIRSHLAALERDGIVRQQGVRRGTGKPSYDYELTPEAEQLFPKAYAPVLRTLLDELAERLGPSERDAVLRATGRRIAAAHPGIDAPLSARLQAATELLGALGGLATVETTDDGIVIQGHSCPLAEVVQQQPSACCVAEALLAEIAGVPVREQCTRGERPRCRFVVGPNTP